MFCKTASSQTLSIAYIDSLVSVIDTSTYRQKTMEGIVTAKPGNDKGGVTETYYLDTISQRLMKVEIAQALYDKKKHITYVELTTYYYEDKLIMVKTSNFDSFGYPSFRKSLSSGVYYYENGTIISSKETGYKHGGINYISKAKTYRDVLYKMYFPN